jgi:hypothetical protein
MWKTVNYKKYSLEALVRERTDGQGYMAEVDVRRDRVSDTLDTLVYLKQTFPSGEAGIEAALQAGRYMVDVGFEPKSIVSDLC